MKLHFMLVTAHKRVFDYLPKKDLSGAEELFHHRMVHRTKSSSLKIEWALKNAVIFNAPEATVLEQKKQAFQAKGYGASLISDREYADFISTLNGKTPASAKTVSPVNKTLN